MNRDKINGRRVVVTGMGIVSPVGNNVKDFWQSLMEGKNGIGEVQGFDTEGFKAKLGAEVKDFNIRDYMSKPEASKTDVSVHYGFAAACQAMEDSGIEGKVDPERIGVYMGTGIGGIHTFVKEDGTFAKRGPSRVSPYFIPMLISNMASGMIAIKFNCRGAALATVTACASGANAIGEAVRAIRHGYMDAAIAGGAEAALVGVGTAGFINMQALSTAEDPDAASLPFDSRRGGFVMGEGGAVVIVEEYEHAVARGAKIYGEVCGYGSTCDAYHMTAPAEDADEAARAIAQALEESGFEASDCNKVYVNAHGTGTPMNDRMETRALKKAFGEEGAKKIKISSTKSMTGHMLGAAGAAESIVCLLALNEGMVPPTINLKSPDPDCDLDYVPEKAVKADVELAVSNSFGFGGHNASLAFRRV